MTKRLTIEQVLYLCVTFLFGAAVLAGSIVPPGEKIERVRAFTRQIEFDYVAWTFNALQIKLSEMSLSTGSYLSAETRRGIVVEYLELIAEIQRTNYEIETIYAAPEIQNPDEVAKSYQENLSALENRRRQLAPLAESILQSQISTIVAQLGLAFLGQPIPPVLYHSTPLPLALIVSPRNVIRQEANISLLPELTLEEQIALEERVDNALDVSSLVVKVGGVGTYPTMVQQTSSLDWLSEVVAHEWIHNFLTLRPLGMSYTTSPELRIMNETAASIAGKEIARALLELYYPEFLPPPPPEPGKPPTETEPPAFDFRREMHITRLKVDELLAAGKIVEAESYMEMRRRIFWEHGYRHLRKLNQAYFAFHGAYADEPGGAAGATEDPVGTAVRTLRAQSSSLADFLKRISWMWSFEQLQAAVAHSSS